MVNEGDRVWINGVIAKVLFEDSGPAVVLVKRNDTSVPVWFDEPIPDHPALPAVSAWLAEHRDEAVELLTCILEDAQSEEHRDAELWDGYRPERAAWDRRCSEAAASLANALYPLMPTSTLTEEEIDAIFCERFPRLAEILTPEAGDAGARA